MSISVLSSQWFAPTELVISFETEGQGKFTPEEIDGLVERDSSGRVIALNLPKKTVLIGNHQVRLMLESRSPARTGEHAPAI